MTEKVGRLAELLRSTPKLRHAGAAAVGRNRFTRDVDAALIWLRRSLPRTHRAMSWLFGSSLFGYAWLVARTTHLVTVGERQWPDIPAPCVLAIWHSGAPSLLAAIAKLRPKAPLVIMISTEPRGDTLTLLCRRLGFRVIRGDWEHHGWEAVRQTAEQVAKGACALITPDGGGPRLVARSGALVLAAAAMAPLVVLGAACSPALSEPHKWDQPRNPVPFGRIAISMSAPRPYQDFENAEELESARQKLEQELQAAKEQTHQALNLPSR